MDLTCVSYFALAQLWGVEELPAPDEGAEIVSMATSVGADGPVVAALASDLGMSTRLISNGVSDDPDGKTLIAYLRNHGVSHDADLASPGTKSPLLLTLGDASGRRVWLVRLEGVAADIGRRVASWPELRADLAYVDAYRAIETSAVATLRLAAATRQPVFVNLGQEAISLAITSAIVDCGSSVAAVQVSIGEASLDEATEAAGMLRRQVRSGTILVTFGSGGAVAIEEDGTMHHSAGFDVPVVHAHCAGAAFSAGYIAARWRGLSTADALPFACALGALRVSNPPEAEGFRLETVQQFLRERSRNEHGGAGEH